MDSKKINNWSDKENINPSRTSSVSEERILLGANSVESLRRIVHQNVKENFVTDFGKSLIRIRELQAQGQKYLNDHDEEMAFVSFYNCSESVRFIQAHEKYNSRTHDEAINKIKSTLENELTSLELSLSDRYASLDVNHNSESFQRLIKTNLSMKNQIENLKTKNSVLVKQNSELRREIEYISKCKNCSKSETTERQLFSCGHYFCTRCATKLYDKKRCPDCSKRPQFMICFSL